LDFSPNPSPLCFEVNYLPEVEMNPRRALIALTTPLAIHHCEFTAPEGFFRKAPLRDWFIGTTDAG
jgi:hypothetical protein